MTGESSHFPLHPSGRRLRLGIVGQPEYFRFCYETDLDDVVDVLEIPFRLSLPDHVFASLDDFRPDITIFFRGEQIPEGVLGQVPGVRIAISTEPFPRLIDGRWHHSTDSMRRYLSFRRIRDLPFDHLFHYDPASLPLLHRDGLSGAEAFLLPVATATYRPIPAEPIWDLLFVGRSTSHREAYFGKLKHDHEFLHISHGVWGSRLVELVASSAIALNVHAANEVSWEPRVQMLLACGAFVISEPITPNRLLRPGEHYVAVHSPAELSQAVRHFLHHDDERRAIADAGRRQVVDCLSSRRSFAYLLGRVMDGSASRFTPTSGSRTLNSVTLSLDVARRIKGLLLQ